MLSLHCVTEIVAIISLANMVMQWPENMIILYLWQVHCNTLGFININCIGQSKLCALSASQTEVGKFDYFSSLYVKQNIHTIHIQQAHIQVVFLGCVAEYFNMQF